MEFNLFSLLSFDNLSFHRISTVVLKDTPHFRSAENKVLCLLQPRVERNIIAFKLAMKFQSELGIVVDDVLIDLWHLANSKELLMKINVLCWLTDH